MNNELGKTIGNRINTLLAEQNKKQKDLAAYLGVQDNTISYFASGRRLPNTGQIIKIAEFFNTSCDFLLGLTKVNTVDKDKRFVCESTGLSKEAVESLIEAHDYIKQYPSADDIETFTILSNIISSGLLVSISSYISEYKKELIKASEKYNEMTDFFLMNRPDDNTPTEYDDFTPSDIDKELSYRLFMVQEEVKDYVKSYAKTECELFVEAHKRYMNCD